MKCSFSKSNLSKEFISQYLLDKYHNYLTSSIGEDFYLHKIAHDNKFSRYNLGQIALLKLIELLINFRVKRFHFLWSKGVDYKIRFGGYHMLYGHTHSTQHTHFLITRNCALRKLWKQSLLF